MRGHVRGKKQGTRDKALTEQRVWRGKSDPKARHEKKKKGGF